MPSKPSSTAAPTPKTMPQSLPAMSDSLPETESNDPTIADLRNEIRGYAKARERFLMEAFPEVYQKMVRDGTLAEHLQDVGEEAALQFQTMVQQTRAKVIASDLPPLEVERILKSQAPLQANEIVLNNVVYVQPQ